MTTPPKYFKLRTPKETQRHCEQQPRMVAKALAVQPLAEHALALVGKEVKKAS